MFGVAYIDTSAEVEEGEGADSVGSTSAATYEGVAGAGGGFSVEAVGVGGCCTAEM